MFVTNPSRKDGFGAQVQNIIYTVIYAKLNHLTFLYTPLKDMEHNYDNDPLFIQQKEDFLGFLNHFPLVASQNPELIQPLDIKECYRFVESHFSEISVPVNICREVFWKNKNRPFPNLQVHIAVHIRRPNIIDNRIQGSDIPDRVYYSIINNIQKLYPQAHVHIYSQATLNKLSFDSLPNIHFHIDEPIESTFLAMVMSDLLVISPSSFSYAAALLRNDDNVYYLPFWHPALPGWRQINIDHELICSSFRLKSINDKIEIPSFATTVKIDVGTSMNAPNSEVWTNTDQNCFVFAFEPNQFNIKDLYSGSQRGRYNTYYLDPVKIGKQIVIYECALSDKLGITDFYCTEEDGGTSSLFRPKNFKVKAVTNVAVHTLFSFFERLTWTSNVQYISMLKIDAQSADYDIIVGAGKYLSERVVYLVIETSTHNHYEHNENPEYIKVYLEEQGFVCTKWAENALFYNKIFEHIKESIAPSFIDT